MSYVLTTEKNPVSAPKEWSNQKIKVFFYIDYRVFIFNVIKCLYFFDLTTL